MFGVSKAVKLLRRPLARTYSAAARSSPLSRPSLALVGIGGIAVGFGAGHYFSRGQEHEKESSDLNAASTAPLSSVPEPQYASPEETKEAIAKIKALLGADRVNSSEDEILQHSDSSFQTRHPKPNEHPITVVYPNSTEEVSQVVRICHDYRVPLTAFSGGTSLEGHFIPVYGGISMDMSNMDKVIVIHKEDLDVVVQPAVGWEDLNEQLKSFGLFFGPDPGPGAEIGGMIGTSCSGTNAYRYGTMRENVINLTVVLADGTVIKTRRRPRKSSAGYNLTGLFIGGEGTLGIVTEATLKVIPIPAVRRVAMLTFPSIKDATDTVESVLLRGLNLDAMELMDSHLMKIINDAGATDRKWAETTSLLLRFAGATPEMVTHEIDEVKKISKNHHALDLEFAKNDDDTEELWSARKSALWSVFAAAPAGYKVWTTDAAVPISQLSRLITETKADIDEHKITGALLGHVGDGNFHAVLTYNPETQLETVEGVVDRMIARAIHLDGTCTGEHGVGTGKRHFVVEEVGESTVDTMRQLKRALDPNFILNPGKVFSISKLHDISDH